MVISVEQFENGIATFAKREIVANLKPNSIERFAAKAAIARRHQILEKKNIYNMMSVIGAITDDNQIDIDLVRDTLLDSMDEEGLRINTPMLGNLSFSAEDVKNCYEDIMEVRQ